MLGVKVLNNLPENNTASQTLKIFRKKLKQYYIAMFDDK